MLLMKRSIAMQKGLPILGVFRYLNLETKHGHYGAKRNKATERTKKKRSEDRLNHWANSRMALVSPNVPVCQDLKDKNQIGYRKEKSASRRTVPRGSAISPKVIELEVVEGLCRKAMNQTKGRIDKWFGDPD